MLVDAFPFCSNIHVSSICRILEFYWLFIVVRSQGLENSLAIFLVSSEHEQYLLYAVCRQVSLF